MMSQGTKKQHYIPRFYLKHFCYGNESQIGIYLPDKEIMRYPVGLKDQAYRDYFYGKDGVIEEWLSKIENEAAPILNRMCSSGYVPNKDAEDYLSILHFVLLMSMRNPSEAEGMGEARRQLFEKLADLKKEDGVEDISGDTSLEDIKMVLKQVPLMTSVCSDLNMKLIINKSKEAFITSDNPVIKYNQFLEERKWPLSVTGYASIGIQLFFPLNPTTMLLIYDDNTYKVGNRKDVMIEIFTNSEVDQLNTLQVLSRLNLLFFSDKSSSDYISRIHQNSLKYKRANQHDSEWVPFKITNQHGKFDSKVIRRFSSESRIDLRIRGVNLTKKAKEYELSNSAVQLRDRALRIIQASGFGGEQAMAAVADYKG